MTKGDGSFLLKMELLEEVDIYKDISHANLDIGFVVDLYEEGIVFNYEDLRKFVNTSLKLMRDGSLSDPEIGSRVNSLEVIEVARNKG